MTLTGRIQREIKKKKKKTQLGLMMKITLTVPVPFPMTLSLSHLSLHPSHLLLINPLSNASYSLGTRQSVLFLLEYCSILYATDLIIMLFIRFDVAYLPFLISSSSLVLFSRFSLFSIKLFLSGFSPLPFSLPF